MTLPATPVTVANIDVSSSKFTMLGCGNGTVLASCNSIGALAGPIGGLGAGNNPLALLFVGAILSANSGDVIKV